MARLFFAETDEAFQAIVNQGLLILPSFGACCGSVARAEITAAGFTKVPAGAIFTIGKLVIAFNGSSSRHENLVERCHARSAGRSSLSMLPTSIIGSG